MKHADLKHPPLVLRRPNWRSRWLVLDSWRVLHRVSAIKWEHGEKISGEGVTVCGQRGRLMMPGIISRMGLPRCAHCCDTLRIERGVGCPENMQGRKRMGL